jgi:SAM-dependent methyltransferase
MPTSRPVHPSTLWQVGQFRTERGNHPGDAARLAELLALPELPRSSAYDPVWIWWNHMGPNVLWLTELLTQRFDLRPRSRVLDLGCGTALSSIFLAREFNVEVWATDLWISATDNQRRIAEAQLQDVVFPIHAEAHELPFADEFFDVLISVDAYHYFGATPDYLGYCSRFVRPGGVIAVLVPSHGGDRSREPTIHSAQWWQRLWDATPGVDVQRVETLPGGWELWHRFCEAAAAWDGHHRVADVPDGPLLLAERELGFAGMLARRTAS